jgi:hypothetical protein
MAAKSYIANTAGRLTRTPAIVTSTGAANDGDLVALDAAGKLDASVFPAGVGQNNTSAVASEALAAGDIVNLWDNAGTASVRKADGTAVGKEAHGFVKANFASSASATVYLAGNTLTTTGLTTGARYYLSTTPGTASATPLTTAGNVSQLVGIAANATTLLFDPEEAITM